MLKILKVGVVFFALLIGAIAGLVVGYKAGVQGSFNPDLQSFAGDLSKAPLIESNPLALAAEVVEVGGEPNLRCKLTNVSGRSILIYEHALPCKFNHDFRATGISLTGSSRLLFTWPFSMITSSPEPQVELVAGQTLLIEGELRYMFQDDSIPKNDDVLILWSYTRDRYVNTGVALLPGKEKTRGL